MKVYFDPVTMGFYTTEHFKTFPSTAVNIPVELYKELQAGETRGLQIACDDAGYPFLKPLDVDIEFLISAEHIWINTELARAGLELDKVQDSDATAVGTVGQWRDYRKALRAWAGHKDFPKKEFRPKSPK